MIRRSYHELKSNHLRPLLNEYGELISYNEGEKRILLPNGSSIAFGYCAAASDVLRYQGQEYDIIAIDEATQLSEIEAYRPELRFADAVKGLHLYGAKIVRPEELYVLQINTPAE